MTEILKATNLRKTFHSKRGDVEAVRGIDLSIEKGEIFGFLGPNGAGKTTTLRMLTTLLMPDEGDVTVAGLSLQHDPSQVRRVIGYVSQAGGSDRTATGRENLILQGRLYDMTRQQAKEKADQLIAAFNLESFADRIVNTYSGGQRRRLDVAVGMACQPEILFLDEPTTGLDPQNRASLWDEVRRVASEGTTVFLTTHYMDEADVLSDRLAIMDHGEIVALGTPIELKKQVGGDTILLELESQKAATAALKLMQSESYAREVNTGKETSQLRLIVEQGDVRLPHILKALDSAGLAIKSVSLSHPTLDDVFLAKTGRSLRDE